MELLFDLLRLALWDELRTKTITKHFVTKTGIDWDEVLTMAEKQTVVPLVLQALEQEQLRKDIPEFAPGDTLKVHVKVVEGSRERIQVFEGVVIKRQGGSNRETFTVRKNSNGIGVEKTWPLHSPKIEKVEVTRRGKVRRAKLTYLRGRVGKASKVKEAVTGR